MRDGSLVECIHDGPWYDTTTNKLATGPVLGEICTINGFFKDEYLIFLEYPGKEPNGEPISFNRYSFREIQPPMPMQIQELISETQTV